MIILIFIYPSQREHVTGMGEPPNFGNASWSSSFMVSSVFPFSAQENSLSGRVVSLPAKRELTLVSHARLPGTRLR